MAGQILITAVVLGGLYSLGLFNGASLSPKAAPGACQVYRPNGPLSTTYISLQGICNAQPPQYVASFNSMGTTSYIITGTTGLPLGNNPRSVFIWVYTKTPQTSGDIYDYGICGSYEISRFSISSTLLFSGYGDDYGSTLAVPTGVWSFIGYVYNANSTNGITLYLNGNSVNHSLPHALQTTLPATNPSAVGYSVPCGAYPFNGLASNLQVYNTTLDANSIQALYQEGVGGAPINLQSLVAWWPLNGNANDYSGNLNSGQSTAVIYTNQWQNGYIAP